jgi:hypothetical protein
MTQRCTNSGNAFLNETRAKAFDLFRALRSRDGGGGKVRQWRTETPMWGAFLMAVIATNTILAVAAWFAVAAIRG